MLDAFQSLLELLAIEQIVFGKRNDVGEQYSLFSTNLLRVWCTMLATIIEECAPMEVTDSCVLGPYEVLQFFFEEGPSVLIIDLLLEFLAQFNSFSPFRHHLT